jgi:phosphatidylserine decarboxylase
MVMSGIITAWREVKPIVLGLMGTTSLAFLMKKYRLSLLSVGLLAWVFYFFRDPERTPDSFEPEVILSPADGHVMNIDVVEEPDFLRGPSRRVTIFLSLFDVHIQRAPYAGIVKLLKYQSGNFAPAFLKHSDENESNLVGLKTVHGTIAIKQMTGLLARRIVCWANLDDELSSGQRFGLIKFGSRVDLFLPVSDIELLVQVGQQLYGGQTVVARWKRE